MWLVDGFQATGLNYRLDHGAAHTDWGGISMKTGLRRKIKECFGDIHIKLNNIIYIKRYQRDRLQLKCKDLTTRMKENFTDMTKSTKCIFRQA